MHYTEQGEPLDLQLVVELSRHGERASKKIFNLTADGSQNFQVGAKELTETGAKSHHKLGHALRQEFDALNLINTAEYSPEEVYVQSTDKERTIRSAVAQLEGLYDRSLTWPAKNDTGFVVNHVPLKEDKLMVMSNETCKRWSQA